LAAVIEIISLGIQYRSSVMSAKAGIQSFHPERDDDSRRFTAHPAFAGITRINRFHCRFRKMPDRA
jgi:hypothetical protein